MAHYAGIAGSVMGDDIVTSGDTVKSFDGMLTDVLVSGSGTLTGVSPAGNDGGFQVGREAVRDGASNVMIVAESSGWCYDSEGNPVDNRVQGTGPLGVFVTGASGANITDSNITVKYPIAHDVADVLGQRNPNAPINSGHRDGANVLMVGGTVHFLTTATDIEILYSLSDRDDGAVDVGSL